MQSGEGMAQNLVKDAFSGSGAKELLAVPTVAHPKISKKLEACALHIWSTLAPVLVIESR
jgi:hypothetical protein